MLRAPENNFLQVSPCYWHSFLVGLCDVKNIDWSLGTYCAAALRILAHGEGKVKAKIVGQGGIPPLLRLCDPELVSDDAGAGSDTDFDYWYISTHKWNWRGAWNKALSDSWSHVESSFFVQGSEKQFARRILQSVRYCIGFFPWTVAHLVQKWG